MKKLAFILCVIIMTGCIGSSDSNISNATEGKSSALTSEIESGGANLTQASIIAQEFVKDNFASDCDFEDLDIRGEAIEATPGRFKVLQKFTSKKFGSEQEYVYKIFIHYYGGEWEDKNSWDYGQLTIENTSTGEQYVYNGSMKQRDAMPIDAGTKKIAGIEFKETHKKSVIIYSTPKQIPYEKVKLVAQELKGSKQTIMFYVDSEIENGEDYASVLGYNFFYYPLNKIDSLK